MSQTGTPPAAATPTPPAVAPVVRDTGVAPNVHAESVADATKEAPEAPAKEAPAAAKETTETPAYQPPPPEVIQQAVEAAKAMDPKLEGYTKEFYETGDLSAEAKAKAAQEFAVPPAMVDAYLAGLRAQNQMTTAKAAETVAPATAAIQAREQAAVGAFGGEAQFKQFQEWAKTNLDDAAIKTFNDSLNTATPEVMAIVAKSYMDNWKASGQSPVAPRDINRNTSVTPTVNAGAVTGYASREEQVADMSNPRYKTDPTFREQVMAKTAATTAF